MKGQIARGYAEGSWYLRYELPIGEFGRRQRQSETFRGTKKEAEQRLRDLLTAVERGIVNDRKLTVADVAQSWLAAKKGVVEPRSWASYDSLVRLRIIPSLGSRRVATLRPSHIREAISEWSGAGRNEKVRAARGYTDAATAPKSRGAKSTAATRISARTIQHALATLRMILRSAVEDGIISANPALPVEMPRREHREMNTLIREQVATLLRAAAGTDMQMPIALLVTTGLRRGEAFGLKWSDIDLERGRLTVRRSLEKLNDGTLQYKSPKTTRSARTVALAPFLIDRLRAHRMEEKRLHMQFGIGRKDDGPVFADLRTGLPIDLKAFSKRFARLVERAGLDVRLHDLRHSYGMLALQNGVDLKTLSTSMGHSTIAITANTYLHASESLDRNAAALIGEAIGETVMAAMNAAERLGNEAVISTLGQNPAKICARGMKKARRNGLKSVAGTGFEPVTFGL